MRNLPKDDDSDSDSADPTNCVSEVFRSGLNVQLYLYNRGEITQYEFMAHSASLMADEYERIVRRHPDEARNIIRDAANEIFGYDVGALLRERLALEVDDTIYFRQITGTTSLNGRSDTDDDTTNE